MTPRTLRDDFAMAALTGLLVQDGVRAIEGINAAWTNEERATEAYAQADAMLLVREAGARDTEPAPPPKPESTPAPNGHEWVNETGSPTGVVCSTCGAYARDGLKLCSKQGEGAVSDVNTFLTPGGVEPEGWKAHKSKPEPTPAPQTAMKMKDWTEHDWSFNERIGALGVYACSRCGVRRDEKNVPKECKR